MRHTVMMPPTKELPADKPQSKARLVIRWVDNEGHLHSKEFPAGSAGRHAAGMHFAQVQDGSEAVEAQMLEFDATGHQVSGARSVRTTSGWEKQPRD